MFIVGMATNGKNGIRIFDWLFEYIFEYSEPQYLSLDWNGPDRVLTYLP